MRPSITGVLSVLSICVVSGALPETARAESARPGELPAAHRHIDTSTEPAWTARDYVRAKPVSPRWRSPDGATSQSLSVGRVVDRAPRSPTRPSTIWQSVQLADPARLERAGRNLARRTAEPHSFVPQNRGTTELDYTSSRLIPTDARLVYPYLTVGKVFMRQGGDSFICSGAVIDKRIVLTAGHCVHDGDDFLDSFRFVPAYHDGSGPTGEWQVTDVWSTGEWIDGGGDIPNVADFGLLVIQDKNGDKIGSVTGTLGWSTYKLAPNHLTLLGYPANLDKGMKMHQVQSSGWLLFELENVGYGSDMSGGSSGGPWVQNFNVKAKGQKGGQEKKRLRVVGVTSWGLTSKKPRLQGSSTLNEAFVGMWQQACSQSPGNC